MDAGAVVETVDAVVVGLESWRRRAAGIGSPEDEEEEEREPMGVSLMSASDPRFTPLAPASV